MDCHGAGGDRSFNSLIPDALDARCEFVVQTRWTEYTAMLEDGCDAALFVGQHARAGRRPRRALATPSARPAGTSCASTARPSARSASTPRCAARGAARSRSSPATTSSARRRPSCSATACRRSRSRPGSAASSARHLSPARARERLEEAARDALADLSGAPVYDPGAPCTIAVELATPDHADAYRNRAGVTLTGPRSVESTRADVVGRLARALPLSSAERHAVGVAPSSFSRTSATVTGEHVASAAIGVASSTCMFVSANVAPPVPPLHVAVEQRRWRRP